MLKRFLETGLRAQHQISIYHEFKRPPYGGGNQFLLALRNNLRERGYGVATNIITKNTRACVFNSYNFDFDKLRQFAQQHPHCLMLHRVDGPIGVYRGFDDGTDRRIHDINAQLADVTIFQSQFSSRKHEELGLQFVKPRVIVNAPDSKIFNRRNMASPLGHGKLRLVSASWSENPKKGGAVYRWLDQHLDFTRYEYTFVGRTKESFSNIAVKPPVSSVELAKILKRSDIFITASEDDPCSNALIEALHCGLPAVYLKSGGHSELVKKGGLGFSEPDEVVQALAQIADSYASFQRGMSLPTIHEVAGQYLQAMNLSERVD